MVLHHLLQMFVELISMDCYIQNTYVTYVIKQSLVYVARYTCKGILEQIMKCVSIILQIGQQNYNKFQLQ